jgi:hypothetical protein
MQLRLSTQALATTVTAMKLTLVGFGGAGVFGRPALYLALDENGNGALDASETVVAEAQEVDETGDVRFTNIGIAMPAASKVDLLVMLEAAPRGHPLPWMSMSAAFEPAVASANYSINGISGRSGWRRRPAADGSSRLRPCEV